MRLSGTSRKPPHRTTRGGGGIRKDSRVISRRMPRSIRRMKEKYNALDYRRGIGGVVAVGYARLSRRQPDTRTAGHRACSYRVPAPDRTARRSLMTRRPASKPGIKTKRPRRLLSEGVSGCGPLSDRFGLAVWRLLCGSYLELVHNLHVVPNRVFGDAFGERALIFVRDLPA